jgi:aspartate dehydrogenase
VEIKRIALIGCGAIGTVIAKSIDDGTVPAELVVVMDKVAGAAESLAAMLDPKPKIVNSIEELIESNAQVVVEAASQEAVRGYAESILASGKDLVVMSIGALLDKELRRRLTDAAQRTQTRMYIPSGAIGGIDAIGALGLVGIVGIVLTVRKNPKGLSVYLNDQGIDPRGITQPRVLYEGDVETAVKLFPANVNVAASLALASNSEVKVRVVADPSLERNVHEIEVISNPSNLRLRFENLPHPDNQKTSFLAALSVVRLLQRIAGEELQVGT